MKRFSNYQWVPGEPKLERDKQEEGSKFWNEGKWENFVKPFLPESGDGQILVDMGCNAGVFLKEAEEMGFTAIGVESDRGAYDRAVRYKERINGRYTLHKKQMERAFKVLPVSDYMVFANAHYYFTVHQWLEFMDMMIGRVRHCIIVTADKRKKRPRADASLAGIRDYFRRWEEVGFIDELPLEGDPFPRRLWGLCFKSPYLERVPIADLDCGNHVQDNYYAELDAGTDPFDTKYYRILKKYREGKWSNSRLEKHMLGKKAIYEDIKKRGLTRPLVVGEDNRIYDGNHRFRMLQHLGHDSVIIRRVK